MKSKEFNKKKITKKIKKIGEKQIVYLEIKSDDFNLDIMTLPNENKIKFKFYYKKINELSISTVDIYDTYYNIFDLNYFKKQTRFFNDININTLEDLSNFFDTYFQQYQNDYKVIPIEKNMILIKLFLMDNKIEIIIELVKHNANVINNNYISQQKSIENDALFYEKFKEPEKKKDININSLDFKPKLSMCHSCENLKINRRYLQNAHPKKQKNNIDEKQMIPTISENKNNYNILLKPELIPIIKKFIPLLKDFKRTNINLLYKSSVIKDKISSFHSYCDDKGPTLILVMTEEKRSFICYSSKSWHGVKSENVNKVSWHESNTRDDDIKIIDVNSKRKMTMSQENKSNNGAISFIQQCYNYGPSFIYANGLSFKIFGEDKYLNISFITKNKEEEIDIKTKYDLNKNNFFNLTDYEVYGINK